MPAAQFVIGTLNIKAVMPCLATAREARASMRRRPNCGQKLSSIGCRLPDSMLCQSPLVLPGVVQNDCPEPLSQSELATKPADKASQEHPPHPCWTRPQVHLTNACARCDCAQSRACVQQGRSRKQCSWMVRYVWPTCLGLLLMQGRLPSTHWRQSHQAWWLCQHPSGPPSRSSSCPCTAHAQMP